MHNKVTHYTIAFTESANMYCRQWIRKSESFFFKTGSVYTIFCRLFLLQVYILYSM